ncbi:MAG: right-handed parallel beta-helix repeat-containing protein [Planctomycetes bacterium]|nr:right-handed parallel beta-helix repeat-containing protein [Planctomycetota bacterium]
MNAWKIGRSVGFFSLWMWLALKAGGADAVPLEIYLAPGGSDENPGTLERPFATLERAREALRQLKKQGGLPPGGASVWLRGGAYPRGASFELGAEDSGAPGALVVYRAAAGEEARLLGGKAVAGFRPVSDPQVLERLDEKARAQVLEADLRAQGIQDFGRLRSRGFGRSTAPSHLELFFKEKPMTLARWPDEGFVKIAALAEVDPAGDGHGGKIGKLEAGFRYEGDRPRRWKSAENIWVHGYWAWDWANSYEEVALLDVESRLVKTRPPHGLYGFRAGQRFYFLNVIEELDRPGEYYVDPRKGMLYFWPPEPVKDGDVLVSLLEAPLVSMKDASNVVFRGIIFECARGSAVQMSGGEKNLVAACTLRNLGNYAVIIQGGSGSGARGCDLYNTGDGGVQLHGGDRATLAPAGHFGDNNHLHHLARWSKCYQPAFLVSGVGCRVSHNLIHDHPHCAILFSGNEHVIELNEIHHVCLETGDVGAIYTGRDWTYRGNRIQHNFIHHTGGVGMGSMGVYLDDCVSGETVSGNVFYKVTRAAFIGGGRDNLVENNIFVDCAPAVWVDGRGLDRSPVWHDMVYKTMKSSLLAMRHREPPYRDRYPKLKELEAYYEKDAGVPPEGNIVRRNISAGGKWLEIGWHARAEMVEARDNLVGEDPRFIDRDHMNFQLRDDSPAWKLGFQRIPFEEIGLRRDEFRKELAPRR